MGTRVTGACEMQNGQNWNAIIQSKGDPRCDTIERCLEVRSGPAVKHERDIFNQRVQDLACLASAKTSIVHSKRTVNHDQNQRAPNQAYLRRRSDCSRRAPDLACPLQ
jgi:hypothetical protein